jgi:hypothetical protein
MTSERRLRSPSKQSLSVRWVQSKSCDHSPLLSIKVTVRGSDPTRGVGTFSAVTWARRWLAASTASCPVRVYLSALWSDLQQVRTVLSTVLVASVRPAESWAVLRRFVNSDVLKIFFAYYISVQLGSEHDVVVEWRLSSGRIQVSECNCPERNFLGDFLSYFRKRQVHILSHHCHWSSVPSIDAVSW